MSEIDAGFLEVLASCTSADGEVDYTDDGWKPEDGDYTVLLERFTSGTKEKNGIANGWAKAYFRIVNGDYEGRSFSEFFWLPSSPKNITFGMSNLLRLGTCLSGRELKVAEITEACEQANAVTGSALLNVAITSSTWKSDSKVHTTTKFKSLVDAG
jgi:hypothetical protein